MSLIDEYSELQKKKNGGQRSRSSLLQEHIEKNGTSGLNERYVETALQNGGGFGFTQVSKATPIAQNANEYESSTHNSGLYNTTMSAAEYQKEIERIAGERKKVSGNYDYAVANVAGKQRSGRSSKEEIKAAQEEVDAYKKQLADLDRQLEEMKSGKWAAEGGAKYSSISSNADYAEKSKIIDDSKARGFGITIGDKYFGTGDDVYAYINDIDGRQSDMKVAVNGSTGEAGLQKYKYMTQREKDNYNYIYQTEGKKAANKYLAYISYDLDARRTQKVGEWQADFAEDHPYISSAATVGPNQMSIIGLVDVAGQNISRNISGEYKPINYNSPGMDATRMTTTIRSTVSQNLADEYGTINLDSEEHPVLSRVLNGKNWGDVYQLGMSMADSASTAALGKFTGIGAAGTVLLGGSAGSQGVLTALDKGATDEQALAMGILNGTFEALFEYVSLDNLLKGDTKNILTSFFKQGFIEGTEELGTTLANTIADICVMAEKSDYKSGVQAYMDAGYSQQEAERMAMQDIAIGMGWDFVGGAISGGIMGGGKATVNKYIIEPYNYRKVYGENVQELVNESQEINPGNELAKDIQGKIDSNKRVSGLKIRNLVNQNEADMRSNDKAVIQAAVAKQLESYGETGNISAIAQAITNHVAGERLTQADRRLIFQSRYGQRVANELNPENIRSEEYASEWAKNLNTHRINTGEYSRMLQEAETEAESVSTERQAITENVQKAQPAAQQETVQEPDTPVGKMEVTADENISNAKGKTSNAQVSVDDASKKYGAQSIAFIRTYQNGQDVRQYDDAYSSAYEYGKSSVPFDVVKDLDSVSYLTEAQREIAYEAGVAASVSEADAKQQDRMQKANGKTGRRKGAVKLEGAPASSLNEQQKRATRVLRTVAEATGIDIVLTRSEIGEDGKYEGAQGAFKHASPDKIYIDLNAGLLEGKDASDLAKYAMLRTFSHEFIHFVEYWNPVQYNEFRKVVFNEITARGENVNDLIETKMEKTGLSYEKASREVVAEAMTDILPDSKFVQNMAENHKSLFDKLLEKLKEFAADIREYFSNIGANRDAGAKALKEQIGDTIKYLDSIIDMFDTAAEGAVGTFQRAYSVDETVAEENSVAEQVAVKLENAEVSTISEETETIEPEAGQVKGEPKTTISEHGFTATDNMEYGSVEIKFEEKPSEAVRDVLKANKFRWNKAKRMWYGKTAHETIVGALNSAYEAEQTPSAGKSDFSKVWESATQAEKDEVIDAINENTKISHIAPTEIRESAPAQAEEIKEENENGTENEIDERAVHSSQPDGNGAARLLDELQAGDVQRAGGQRETVASAEERGGQAGRDSDREPAHTGDSGSEGTGQSGNLRRDDGVNQEEAQAKAEKLKETVAEQIKQQSTEAPKGSNFIIGESINLPTGEKARFRANTDAIKLIKQLEDEGRYATAAEQEILSKYVGWGGLSNAFGELKYNRELRKSEMVAKPGWEKEFSELRKLVADGILTEEEYNAMSASTKNAHYTSIEVIKAMYDGLAQLGFTGGRMLEPSSGVGNFVGGMPASMSRNVKSWTMVELDRITGQIAKYLYPHADVRIQGFETANIPDNYMDVAIGNVPFGNYGVVDSRYPKRITKAIHNYFFAKTLDKVRTGGVVMFITSSFTMNSQNNAIRQYIMDRADLLGAIRLPNTAFSGNAGTEVVTDILVLKKRAAGTEYAGEAFLSAPNTEVTGNNDPGYWRASSTFPINEYFINHPEMVLGTAALERGMYGANSLTYNPLEGNGTLGDQIREAFKNITGKMDYKAQASPEKANFAVERANKKTKQFGLEVKDGEVYRNIDGHLEVVSSDKATADRVTGLLGVRDAYRTLVNYLQQGQDAKYVKQARKALNKAYDDFAKKYGPINSAKNRSTIADDPDRYSLLSLENYDAKNKTATKADIFTKDTISANKTVRHVDDVATGVIVSINRTGGIDASLIAKITGKTEEDITRELIDSRMAFKTKDGGLEAPETYLSGNVRAKLREAEALAPLDKDFQNNVEELKKVIPQDIPFNDIFTAVGTPWIPNSVYADFIAEMLGGHNSETSYSGPDVTVGRTNTGDFKIVVNNARLRSRYQNTQKWGTRRKSFLDIMTALMSSTSIKVNDYIEDENGRKKPVLNKVETAAAQEKAEEISKEFQEWLWRDENRRKELTSLYNETFNALVTPKYNGTNLTINGLNAEFSLREHQANAVQRIISSGGNTLLAHKVGAGKTLEMAAAAMKLRELGVVKKPVFVVPKALVAQWGVEFKNYFPAARLLVSDEKSFTKANRKVFSNRIANGDYDAVILSYEQFEKIPMSNAYLQDFYQQQINEIIDAIAEEKAESRDGKGLTVKEMEKKKAQLEKKIAELTSKPKDEDNIDFEQLGIDSLFVDEAHNFKNLQYVTRMNNISGLDNTNGSQRAFDLFTKVRYLQGLNGGRGIVFATATPVMNSMAEMYIMQKYLQSDMLEQLGLKTFDAWAKQFGEVVNSVEIKPSGQGFRVKQTFSNFRNLNELQMLFRSFSDVLTDVPGLKIPKMKGGKVKTVVCEPGQFQKDYMAELEKRADNVKNVDPSEDNMLKITSDGRKVSYTQRMIDPTLPYEPGCKIYRCCDNVLSEYRASSKIKGTQIIFCDMATPKGKSKAASTEEADDTELDTSSAKLYEDMKAYLVKRGIPAKEIAFIHDADTDVKKKQLFADVNDGKVRVLIGSTGKMGVGMNAQKRIVAIHHLDAPWRPGDVEQRDGRAFRQKNMNEEVSKYTYVTEGSFDARLWDILDRKQHFINQIMNGEDVGRSAEDTGDVTLSAAEVKALASGNPMIMEQVQLSTDLSKLQDLRRAYNSSITAAKAKLLEDEQKIKTLEGSISNLADDINARVDTYSDGKFSMTIGNKTFTEKKDAGSALSAAIVAKAKQGEFVNVGKFAGFELRVMKDGAEYTGLISGKQGYKFNIYVENTTYMVNHIIGVIDGFETRKKNWMERLEDLRTDRDAQETIIAAPFAKQAELEQKTARFNEVMAILNPKEEQVIVDEQEQSRAYLDSSEPIVARKGKLIIATEPHSNLPKASWEISPGNAIQYQQRTSPLTDREVLSIAAKEISVEGLTDGEIDALRIFDERLNKLYELEQRRVEEGRKYKEQQFGANVDRSEAQKTLNRMKILDSQIKRASESVLDVEKKEVLKRVLQKARKVVEANERAKGQELLKRYRDRRNNAAEIKKYRERIKADTDSLKKWILHPDNKNAYRHVPDTLKNSVIPFLTSIDFTSKQQLKGGDATKADKEFMKNIKALRDSIKQNIDVHGMYSGYNDLPDGFIDEMQEFIDSAHVLSESQQGQFVINRMTSEELKTLSKLVRVVKKLIINMNAFHQNAMFQHAYEAGDNSIDFLRKIGNAKNTGTVSEFLLWQQMRPAYAFERFGKGGKAIYDEFRRGQATLAFNTNKIKEFAESAYSEDEVKAWEKETKTFTLGGDTVKIPVSYIMGFYELSKQKDSLEHILGEGIRVATYTTKNGKRKEKISDVGHALTPGDVSTMIKSLTQRQMEVADSLQKFMASQGAAWGNYVSVARFGEELFTNPQYYPINSDGRHLEATADEHPSAASLYALLNMSFTKSRKEGANNRIVLYSIFDVFSNHMASMAQYNAFALPILDSLKWFNYQQVEKNEDGSKKILGSVREEMARVYGTPEENRPGSGRKGYAENFVINIIKAFNGTETQGVPTDTQGINALHKYNMAQVAYNFRVVVQQPMSITRAGMLVDYKNIIKGLRLSPADIKSNIAEMRKYSGIAAWKSLGFYDVNISRGLADIIKHNKTAMDKIGDAGMWGAEKADLITWSAIWSACKEQVRRDQHMKPSDEGFYDAVTNLFEDVIYKTQVVDSVLTKNEFMRSKGAWARLIGSFMSEPTTTASMLIDAYDKYSMDMQRGFSRQQAWKNNGKYIVRTAYVYGIGAILLAAVQAIPDAFRDDDDYETWLEKWLEAFGGNLVDELVPLNKLPILRDFYELIKSLLATFGVDTYGNEPRSVIFQWRDYLVKSSEIFHDKIVGEDTNYTWYGGAYKLLQAASGIAGLPMAAVTRELCAAWNAVVGAMAPSLKVKTYDAGDKANIKYAYQDGYLTDDEAVEKLMNGKDSNGDPLFTDRKEAIKEVTKWKCKVETGIDNEDLKNAYNSGKITYNEAIEYIMKYRGKTWDEAVKQIKQWGE